MILICMSLYHFSAPFIPPGPSTVTGCDSRSSRTAGNTTGASERSFWSGRFGIARVSWMKELEKMRDRGEYVIYDILLYWCMLYQHLYACSVVCISGFFFCCQVFSIISSVFGTGFHSGLDEMVDIPNTSHRYLEMTLDAGHSPSMMLKGSCGFPMKHIFIEGMSSIPTTCICMRISTKLSELEERKQKRAEEAEAAGHGIYDLRWFVGWWVNDWSWCFRRRSRA